jgi:hypothetical protein
MKRLCIDCIQPDDNRHAQRQSFGDDTAKAAPIGLVLAKLVDDQGIHARIETCCNQPDRGLER